MLCGRRLSPDVWFGKNTDLVCLGFNFLLLALGSSQFLFGGRLLSLHNREQRYRYLRVHIKQTVTQHCLRECLERLVSTTERESLTV